MLHSLFMGIEFGFFSGLGMAKKLKIWN